MRTRTWTATVPNEEAGASSATTAFPLAELAVPRNPIAIGFAVTWIPSGGDKILVELAAGELILVPSGGLPPDA